MLIEFLRFQGLEGTLEFSQTVPQQHNTAQYIVMTVEINTSLHHLKGQSSL